MPQTFTDADLGIKQRFSDADLGITSAPQESSRAAPSSFVPIPETGPAGFSPREVAERRNQAITDLLPLLGATAASFAFPPLAPGMAAARVAPLLARIGLTPQGLIGLGARGAARFGPTIGAGAAGGAGGGAAGEALRGGSISDIASEAVQSGAEMAAGEAAGLGLATGAARVAAPALGVMAPLGRKALEFARKTGLPDSARPITGRLRGLPISPEQVAPGAAQKFVQGVADNLLPSRFVTQKQRRAVVSRVLETPPDRANDVIKKLIHVDTSDAALPRSTKIAETVARRLGKQEATRLGFEREGPRRFVAHVFQQGNPRVLKKRLGAKQFDDALTLNLSGLLEKATRKTPEGRRIIEGDELLAAWRNLPEKTRALYPKATREAVENFAAFASVSRRVPELASEQTISFGPSAITAGTGLVAAPIVEAGLGVATAGTGTVGSGIAFLTARSLMNPRGVLNRWLTNEKLPPQLLRTIGRQLGTIETREAAQDVFGP